MARRVTIPVRGTAFAFLQAVLQGARIVSPRKKKQPTEPPELPELRRKLKFGLMQMAGLALLVLIPLLALFEVFGQGDASVTGRSGALTLTVEYPPRLRFGTAEVIVTQVTNTSSAVMDTITVIFDSSLVSKVAEPRFTPPVTRAFELDLLHVRPGESRRIELDFYAEEYWSHTGNVLAVHAGDTARARVQTFVLP